MRTKIDTTNGRYVTVCKWTDTKIALRNCKSMLRGASFRVNSTNGLSIIHYPEMNYYFFVKHCPLNHYLVRFRNPITGMIVIDQFSHAYYDDLFTDPDPLPMFHVVNDKTGKHYKVCLYNDYIEELPKPLANYHHFHIIRKNQLFEDILYNNNHSDRSCWRIVADPGEYLIFPDNAHWFNSGKPVKSITSYKLLENFTKVK